MQQITFGKGMSERVKLIKATEELHKLRNATKFLLNDISPTFHSASEERLKIKKFMECWLEIPIQEQVRPIERSFERL